MPGKRLDWTKAKSFVAAGRDAEIGWTDSLQDYEFLKEVEERRIAQSDLGKSSQTPTVKQGSRQARLRSVWGAPITEYERSLKDILLHPNRVSGQRFKVRAFGDSAERGFACRRLRIHVKFSGNKHGDLIVVVPNAPDAFDTVTITVPSRSFYSTETEHLQNLVISVIERQLHLKESTVG